MKCQLYPPQQTHPGHLALVVSREEFAEVNNNIAFIEPVNPGLRTANARNTKAQLESSLQFTFQQNEYMKFQATVTALRTLILNAVDDKYISALKHEMSSYANVTLYALLIYIWDTFCKIDDANEQRMKAPWSPPIPIESLFDQLDQGKIFAANGNEIITI